MAARKVLVTGASGLLGREIYATFQRAGWEVLGLAYSRVKGDLVKTDLRDRQQLEQLFNDFKPTVVVHSAAERRPDQVKANPEAARSLNVSVTETITQLCTVHQCFLMYISTSYVFDGTSPPHKPDTPTNPLNEYGRTKLDGEKAVLIYTDSAVIRVPVLYGVVESLDESAVTVLFKAFQSKEPVLVSDYERRHPTHVQDISHFINLLATKSLTDRPICRGMWHFSNPQCYTKYGMAEIMAKAFGLTMDNIVPVKEPSSGALRPFDDKLECSKMEQTFDITYTSLEDSVYDILKPFSQ